MTVTAIHLTIHGRVQNMGYRNWAERTAKQHGLDGWVRNLEDGTVELLISGDAASVAKMHHECERGPDAAHVTRVDVRPGSEKPPAGFRQLESA